MEANQEWKIVFIDDEADIREVIRITLADAGYRIWTAEDGEAGIRLSRCVSPQIVITDIRMPRMHGIQVLETLKQTQPDIEVIVATAFGEMDLAIRALQLDASDFITKPFNDDALHTALARAKTRFQDRKQIRDYTALLEAENAQTSKDLIKSIQYRNNLIESSMDGILGCDAQRRVVTVNRSLENMLNYSREAVIGIMTLDQFLDPDDVQRLENNLGGEGSGGPNRLLLSETQLLDRSGAKIPVQVSASALIDGGGPSGSVFFFRDLRELRRMEREVADQARILHQDKMMSMGRLAASVVHEINNPLSGVLNYIRLMTRILRRGPLPDDRREKFMQYLDLVEAETDRCSHIVSSLLAFSRKSPPTFGPVHIEDLLQRSTALSRHKMELQNIKLVLEIEPELPSVSGDFNQLQQCTINLIFNAIDAMPKGGTLTIGCNCDRTENQLIISVSDSGHGILNSDLPHIFEPFFTTKKEGYGVGLGLSTTFGIMQHHQGSVGVKSRLGEGTMFTLRLPVNGKTVEDIGRDNRQGSDHHE